MSSILEKNENRKVNVDTTSSTSLVFEIGELITCISLLSSEPSGRSMKCSTEFSASKQASASLVPTVRLTHNHTHAVQVHTLQAWDEKYLLAMFDVTLAAVGSESRQQQQEEDGSSPGMRTRSSTVVLRRDWQELRALHLSLTEMLSSTSNAKVPCCLGPIIGWFVTRHGLTG